MERTVYNASSRHQGLLMLTMCSFNTKVMPMAIECPIGDVLEAQTSDIRLLQVYTRLGRPPRSCEGND